MDKSKILRDMEIIFKDVFEEENISLTEATVAGDIDGWDSLMHIQLIVAIEKYFQIKFSSKEIFSWKNVGEILEAVSSKLK